MTPLQQEQFIKWLDEQIKLHEEKRVRESKEGNFTGATIVHIQQNILEKVQTKFQSLLTTPTTDKQ